MIGEINLALQNLMHRKTRSWLTIISILIGITSIFALLSFGFGIQKYMDELAEEAGADTLYIQARGGGAPGTDDNFFISEDDVNFVRKVKGVDRVIPLYMKIGAIEYRDQTRYNFITAWDQKDNDFVLERFTVEVERGRELDNDDLSKVALGYNYQLPDKIFSRPVELGDDVIVNGKEFEVIGFYSEVGNPGDDANIYMTEKALEQMFPESKHKYGFVMLNAERGEDPEELADKIEEKLRKYKDQEEGEEDFFVQTFSDVLETFGTIINILNGVLLLIALISVIVAFVNIMNTMYTSVLERTKEIGIMKAIGARNSNILFIFVFESGMLGLIGGILGVIFGFLIASAGGYVAAVSGFSSLQPTFPNSLIFGCIAFAFAVGAVAGLLPARQASRLKPTDALRYE